MPKPRNKQWVATVGLLTGVGCASAPPPPLPPAVEIEATEADAMAVAPPPRATAAASQSPEPRWPPPATRGEAKKLARSAYIEARRNYDEGDYATAAVGFQKADFYFPGAAPKYNLAECYDRLGERQNAIAAYQRFIDSRPSDKYADRVVHARERIRVLQPPP